MFRIGYKIITEQLEEVEYIPLKNILSFQKMPKH